ncbi:hypothetical protein [Nocardia donostiensis]|uniref:Uncharacterized protein n=1 Tax=Nocardia donostiensis TaxID=1538463 RepID=A0A1W0B2P5_9NOCA|nr:hypothetical protein [Nocardia donostiensis]ONM48601.1 hypothetical protein B0T46_11130 [Nocardia donostiensis]OQS16790.1 hypothetical protein B0T36_03810 [Nocardia donostiensis]OQS23255.1 hypothetical protein B0T44_03130 [Nocardia donostiensis]
MSEETWAALKATPLAELRRRAAIVSELFESVPKSVDGAQRYGWYDGSGQSTVWYFSTGDRVLLLTFHHEEALNLCYDDSNYALQEHFYDGVPEDLVRLVRNRPENGESLNLTDPETENTIHAASGIFWYDGCRWHIADGVVDCCRSEDLVFFDECGLDTCLHVYQFGQDFTPEDIIRNRAWWGWYADDSAEQAALADLREIVARHP